MVAVNNSNNNSNSNNIIITFVQERVLTFRALSKASLTLDPSLGLHCSGHHCGANDSRAIGVIRECTLVPSPTPHLFCPVKEGEDPADGQLPQELGAIFPGQPAKRELGDLRIISPQHWACGVSLPNANASSCATQGSWQNAC